MPSVRIFPRPILRSLTGTLRSTTFPLQSFSETPFTVDLCKISAVSFVSYTESNIF